MSPFVPMERHSYDYRNKYSFRDRRQASATSTRLREGFAEGIPITCARG